MENKQKHHHQIHQNQTMFFFTIYKMLEDSLLQKEPKHSVDKLFTGDSSLKAAQANGKGLES